MSQQQVAERINPGWIDHEKQLVIGMIEGIGHGFETIGCLHRDTAALRGPAPRCIGIHSMLRCRINITLPKLS